MSNQRTRLKDRIYRAVIIGAGNIAANFDIPQSRFVLTHAHAFVKHPLTSLVGIYDIKHRLAQSAADKWATTPYQNLAAMLTDTNPDIISICAPDDQHYALLKQVIKYNPKIIICEKPLALKARQAEELKKTFSRIKIPVLVNYSRRFDSTVQTIGNDLKTRKYGKVISAQAIYTKGILHNGSHAVDLARYLFGEINYSRVLFSMPGYSEQDRSIGAFLNFQSCPQFYLIPADHRSYAVFEFDILCQKARLRFIKSGSVLQIQHAEPDLVYSGYTVLGELQNFNTNLSQAMYQLIDNAVQHLRSRQPLLCTIDEGVKTLHACLSLLS